MKRISATTKIIAFLVAVAVLFAGTTYFVARRAYVVKKEQMKEEMRVDPDAYGGIDRYKMHDFCSKNADSAMKALKTGNKSRLESLLISSDGLDEVMAFADWSEADFDNAVSMGSGSLMTKPNDDGQMDISERFFVDAGCQRYVFFIETLTSEWGRKDSGISALAVTTYDHFDALDYAWNGEPDDQSAVAGKIFWNE